MPLIQRNFSDIITFTRASTSTFTNSVGTIESAAVNTPRIDYDPVTLACRGLLMEEARTNLLTYSEQFDNAAWSKSNMTITINAAQAPDGALTADKMVENVGGGAKQCFMNASASIVSGTIYAISVFIKAGERSFAYIEAGLTPFGVGSFYVNLSTGTVTTATGVCAGATVKAYPNGWFRAEFEVVAISNSTLPPFDLRISSTGADSGSYTGNGVSGIFAWGAQLEAGAFATSYIPTVASQVTRAADVAEMTGANFGSWYNQTEGTFVFEGDYLSGASDPTARVAYGTSSGFFSNSIYEVKTGSSIATTPVIVSGGVSQASLTPFNTTAGTAFKTALAYANNNLASSYNGGAVSTDLLATIPAGQINLAIGSAPWSASLGTINGHIRSLRYYPSRLPNATLQALST